MNTCPACNEPRLGRYCNDGHAMRRTRPMTEAEWAVWYEEHNRAYLGGMALRSRDGALPVVGEGARKEMIEGLRMAAEGG